MFSPLSAFASIRSNRSLVAGAIFTEILISFPTSPFREALFGEMVANFFTSPLTIRSETGVFLSLVYTFMVFFRILPP